jgi:hypothetical protein
MSGAHATLPRPDDMPESAEPPGEEQFWKKYNARFECPIGSAVSVLAHVLIAAVLVFGFLGLMAGNRDRSPVSIIPIEDGDTGNGRPGEDGQFQQLGGTNAKSSAETPPDLKPVKDELERQFREDLGADASIPDDLAKAYKDLDDDLRKKLLGGKGGAGPGPGGTGADSTRARGLRWVLRFGTKSGRDYLNQLKALKAVVMVPVPPENKRMLIIRDPGNPRADEFATDADIAAQADKMQFQDARKDSNEALAEALRLPYTPAAFWAFFPKELEDEMARLEVAFGNKRAEDIRETIFQVIVTGGEARLKVVGQKLK